MEAGTQLPNFVQRVNVTVENGSKYKNNEE